MCKGADKPGDQNTEKSTADDLDRAMAEFLRQIVAVVVSELLLNIVDFPCVFTRRMPYTHSVIHYNGGKDDR